MTLLFGLLIFFGLYLLIDLGRLSARRLQPLYLRKAVLKTAFWLVASGLTAALIGGVFAGANVNILTWLYGLAGLQLGAAIIVAGSTWRHLQTTRATVASDYPVSKLPTLSVCIPARNESKDLEECLRTLTASNYPKLEILVLDDNSQNKRTPEIIRGFAHDGVVFVAGKPPPEHWLAKNYAYKQLAEAANGELLLFAGVDCRFEPDSLAEIVKLLIAKQKTMVSLLPRNILPSRWDLKTLLVQPARYAWELALPRRLLERPPVLSTCWLIKRDSLEKAGGFEAVKRKVVPESYFARQTSADADGYSFVQADSRLGLTSVKSFDEQQATAIRTRYPQLHRRPELVALVSLAELILLVFPLIMAIISAAAGFWWLTALSGSAYLLQSLVYARIVNLTYRRFVPWGFVVFPLAALYDIGLLNYSMWQYEFGEVVWKGRSVTQPLMQVIPELPKAG